MAALNPIDRLDTHDVLNQAPPFEDVNLFTSDRALMDAVAAAGADRHADRLSRFGERVGSAEVIDWGVSANVDQPTLESFDRYGHRVDEVRFHPTYHQLMMLGLDNGIAAVPWNGTPAGHALHAAMGFMLGQVDAGTGCPMTMTYAAVPALRHEPNVACELVPRILASRYDASARPAVDKAGVTIGMAMTEKQGGSDVRANSTRAEPLDADRRDFELIGHKWFCSAPMCDAFLTLGYTDRGLTCFLVPRWRPDGTRNAGFRVMRLKDKLGDRSNASSEVEFHRAHATRVGDEGRGIATIIEMVQHTRLDCVVGSASTMRAAVVQALWHAAHRSAFQRRLIDQPAMTAVLADLVIESEAATALAFRLATAFDRNEALARLLTPIAKYWVCKRAPAVVNEAMECLGGGGYVESGPMPRLFRQSPLNAIWEGSGNVIALDVVRAMRREPTSVEALRTLLEAGRGRSPDYDRQVDSLDLAPPDEAGARHFVERLAVAAQAAVLLAQENSLAEAFCRLRLTPTSHLFGAFGAAVDATSIVELGYPRI